MEVIPSLIPPLLELFFDNILIVFNSILNIEWCAFARTFNPPILIYTNQASRHDFVGREVGCHFVVEECFVWKDGGLFPLRRLENNELSFRWGLAWKRRKGECVQFADLMPRSHDGQILYNLLFSTVKPLFHHVRDQRANKLLLDSQRFQTIIRWPVGCVFRRHINTFKKRIASLFSVSQF